MTNSALPVEPNPTNTNPVTTITSNPAKDLTNQVVNMNKQKSPVNNVMTNNAIIDPFVTNNVSVDQVPVMTNNLPVHPVSVVSNNVPVVSVMTNNAVSNPVVTKNVPVDPVSVMTNNVPVVTNNVPVDPVVTNNVPIDPVITKTVVIDPVVTNHVQVDPALVDPVKMKTVPANPAVKSNVPIDPVVPVKPVVTNIVSVVSAVSNNALSNLATTNHVPANPAVTNNVPANLAVTNNNSVDPSVANNVPVNHVVTNNVPANPVVTNNVPANPTVTNNIPVNPVVTNNVPATPVVINNVQVDPVVIKNVEIDPTATNNVPVDPVAANNVHILPIIPNNIPVQPVVTNNVSVDHVVTNNVPVNPASTYNFLANPAITNNIPAKPVLTSHVEVDPFLTNNVPIDSVVTNSVPVKPVVTNNVPVLPIRANNVPSESVVTNNYPANSVVANNFKVDPIVTNNYPIDHVVTNNVPVLPIRPNNLPVNIVVTNNVPVDPVVTNNVPVLPIRPNNNPVLPIQSNNVPIEAVVALVPSVSNNVPIASVHPVLPLDITNKTSVSHTDPGDPGALIKNKSPLAKTVIESIPIKPGAIINTGQLQPGGATSSSVLLPTAEVPFTQGQRDQLLALNTVADIVNNTTVNGSISPPENQQSSVAVQPNINQPPTATYPIVRGPIEALTKVKQQPVSPSLTTFNNLKPDNASKIAMLANTSEVVLTPNTKSRQINTTHTTYINKFTTVTNSPLADVFSVRQGQVFNPAALTLKASHSSVSNNQVTTSHSNHSEVFLQQHHNSSVPTVITTNNVERSKLNLSNHDNSRFVDVFAHTPVNTSTNTRRLTSNIFDSLLKQGHQLDYILKHTRNVPVWHSYTLYNGSVLTWITIDANSSTSQQVLDQTSNKRTTISTGASLGQISNAFDPVKPTGVFYHPTNAQPVAKATGKSQASTAQVGEQTVYNETGLLIDPELSHLEPNQVSNTSDATANNNRTVSNTTSTPHVVETPANEENIPTEVGIALVPEVGIVADQSPVLSSSLVDSPKEITEISSSKRAKVPNEVHSYSTATNHNTVTAETPKLKTSISQKNTDEVITSLKNLIQRHPSTTHTKRKYTSAEIKNLNKINPTRLLFTIADPMDSTTLPTTSTTVIPATSTVIDQTIHNTAISNNRKDPVGRNTQTSISFNEPTLSITLGKADSVSKPTTTQPSTSDSFNSKDFSELRSILASNGIKTAEELNQLLMKKSETENRQKLNSIAEHFTKTDNKCPSDKPCLWCRSSPAWSYVDGMSGWCMRNCKTQSCVHSRCKCKCVDDDEFSTLLKTIASSDLRGK
ncbi:hypothetical protein LOTGIDRAFT_235365 [Lottia gigantea]|uniref:Uncharacterized protein n=1 Tax=Lottia gigantea TaxID=225164 RepID=V3ZVF1_LOTGI|nr:hypothetical protein LOTGIDRAFT_235365 [Lottia gigantea]ESO86575.1 hypothetical protein LOTGIDRAFT_235365 [Lottia gigantea]